MLDQGTNLLRLHCVKLLSVRSAHTNRITVPHRTIERYKKAVIKKATKEPNGQKKYKGPAIISCKRPEYNHYRGQTYSNFSPEFLASGSWKHTKSNGDYFTINAYKTNPAVELQDEQFEARISSFSDLGIRREITEALKNFSITKPTNIQAQAIPQILKGHNVLFSSETGSGKTLAFLLPIIDKLLNHNKSYGINSTPNRPYGLILVPSRELADQINAVSSELGKIVGYQSYSQCGGRRTQKLLRERTENMMDIVVATPGVLSKVLTNRIYDLSRLQFVILDEIDTLLDDSFSAMVLRIIAKINVLCGTMATESYQESVIHTTETDIQSLPKQNYAHSLEVYEDYLYDTSMAGLQVILSGATVPRGLQDMASNVLPIDSLVQVKTRNVHKLMPHVSQKFYKIPPCDKFETLLKYLKQNASKNMKTMVFCNKSSTVLYLQIVLADNNIQALTLHAQSSSQKRENIFDNFQQGVCNVLLCTDLASRGLDTIEVHHVINYDFPHFISDYIHRTGRVGRVGSHNAGFVVNFISKKWDVDLVWNIETAARRMTELHNVNANIKRKLNYIIKDKFFPDSKLT